MIVAFTGQKLLYIVFGKSVGRQLCSFCLNKAMDHCRNLLNLLERDNAPILAQAVCVLLLQQHTHTHRKKQLRLNHEYVFIYSV